VFRLVRRRRFPLTSTGKCHFPIRSVLVVPPDFDGFLRSGTAGLLHPAADHGVRPVSDRLLPHSATAGGHSWIAPVAPSQPAEVVGGIRLFPPGWSRSSFRLAQRGVPIFLVACSPFEGFPSFAAESFGPLFHGFYDSPRFTEEACPPLSSVLQPVPSRLSGGCLSPVHPVVARLPPLLSLWIPPRFAALSGFRHLPRPQGFDPRSSPLQASSVSALACPILPWAWVPAAVPGLKGVLLISGRSHRGPTPGNPGALRSRRVRSIRRFRSSGAPGCFRFELRRPLSFSALAGSGSARREPPHVRVPKDPHGRGPGGPDARSRCDQPPTYGRARWLPLPTEVVLPGL